MNVSFTWLFVELMVSLVGVALFWYGRKQVRVPHIIAGVVLLIYPYLVSGLIALVAIGIAVLVALWVAVRLGW
jgi:hypothetical protein